MGSPVRFVEEWRRSRYRRKRFRQLVDRHMRAGYEPSARAIERYQVIAQLESMLR
jgi:hypothetical protein